MKPFKLDEHPKIKMGFRTPDGYFDSFPGELMDRIQSETKVVPLHRNRRNWIFAAAAVLVLSLSIPIINHFNENAAPDQASIENYLAYQNLNDDDIVNLLDEQDIDKIKIDYGIENKSIEEALPSDIENYITD